MYKCAPPLIPNPNSNHNPHKVWESVALGPRQSKCPFVYECPRQENSDPIERLCCGTADTAARSPLNAIDPSLLGGDRIIDTIVQDAGAVYYLWMISSFRHGPIYRATCDLTGTHAHTHTHTHTRHHHYHDHRTHTHILPASTG